LIRAVFRLFVIYALVWFVSLNWDAAYRFAGWFVTPVLHSIAGVIGDNAITVFAAFCAAAMTACFVQLPLWICVVPVDRLRGPKAHPFSRAPLRKHLRFGVARFFIILVLQMLTMLILLRLLPLLIDTNATSVPHWLSYLSDLSDRDTWILYGLVHLVAIAIGWIVLYALSEASVLTRHSSYGFFRYHLENAPVSRMLVRVIAFGLFPAAAFAATSHAHPMHFFVVVAVVVAVLGIAFLAQIFTLILERRNEAWLRRLDENYNANDAVRLLRERTIRFLHPRLNPVPPPDDLATLGSSDAAGNGQPDPEREVVSTATVNARVDDSLEDPLQDEPGDELIAEPIAEPASARDPIQWSKGWRVLSWGYRIWMPAVAGVIAIAVLAFAYQWMILPSADQTRVLAQSAHVHIRRGDGDGADIRLLGTRYDFSLNTRLENISKHLVSAVIASEDHRFYEHGVLYKLSKFIQAGARCAWRAISVFSGSRGCRGNSTIGQQLARNLFLSEERSLIRKFKELVWSIKMEAILTKDEILQAYLNRIYLGRGNFGVEMAARSYFGKSASRLSVKEAAILAAAVKRPSWNWQQDKAGAIKRAQTILLVMRRHGFIKNQVRVEKNYAPVMGARPLRKPYLGHLWQWIKPRVEQSMADMPPGDYKLLTTLNAEVQVYARRRLTAAVKRLRAQGVKASQGAVVVMRPNGSVLAMVGGVGDGISGRGTNRAKRTDGLYARPPASSFKPLVYLAALEAGLKPDTVVNGGPVSIDVPGSKPYSPVNHDGKTYGDMSLSYALVKSINTAAVHLLHDKIGFDKLFDVANRLGIDTEGFQRQWGLALGQAGVPVVNMAGAYAAFANGGYQVTPHAFIAVTNEDGKTVWRRGRPRNKRMFEREHVHQLNRMLEQAVSEGTGFRARRRLDKTARIAGKTGTGDSFVDAWFIGYTADVVIAVWIGNDTPTEMKNTYGGGAPAQVFNDIVRDLSRHTSLLALERPIP
jgi:penicillin-binding protein 1A